MHVTPEHWLGWVATGIEQARHYGIMIGFKEHARIGIPVTIVSLLVTISWIWLRTI